ncbi:TetR/AcrR family transcriptional regulator [Actinomadura rudentiformis]|uniref:TetR/AcrR family transcriptional regulator n=1 Tax=Actinomadura rudentiformis TaxID=359158 RepID=UPI00178C33CC|nr:TetR/AcrR family transcriptional regulator [Actinomadura rudentiformis]
MAGKQGSEGHRERLLAAALVCLREKGYAHTTARDLVAASGTNLASIGYHFGGKEALLNEALASVVRDWTARVEQAMFGGPPVRDTRELLERVLVALIDVFDELRPLIISCVEAYAPALRSDALRARLAESYAESRRDGAAMIRRAAAELGVEVPADPEAVVSVLVAISDGLMLQWLADPASTPDARQALDALAALSVVAAPERAAPGR